MSLRIPRVPPFRPEQPIEAALLGLVMRSAGVRTALVEHPDSYLRATRHRRTPTCAASTRIRRRRSVRARVRGRTLLHRGRRVREGGAEDVRIRVSVTNHGPDTARLHVLPTLWCRNTWSWGRSGDGYWTKPGAGRASSRGLENVAPERAG